MYEGCPVMMDAGSIPSGRRSCCGSGMPACGGMKTDAPLNGLRRGMQCL